MVLYSLARTLINQSTQQALESGDSVSYSTDASDGNPRQRLSELFEMQTGHLTKEGTFARRHPLFISQAAPIFSKVKIIQKSNHSASDCAFLRHWDSLLHLEQAGSVNRQPEIWNLTGEYARFFVCVGGLAYIKAGGQILSMATLVKTLHSDCQSSTMNVSRTTHKL